MVANLSQIADILSRRAAVQFRSPREYGCEQTHSGRRAIVAADWGPPSLTRQELCLRRASTRQKDLAFGQRVPETSFASSATSFPGREPPMRTRCC
jgi:hypothetical protein